MDGEPVLAPGAVAAMATAIMRPSVAVQFESCGEADFAYSLGPGARFRVNAYRQRETVALVLRRVITAPRSIDELHLPPVVERLADEHRGLVLVTGPTGSGKTTTLAAMVDHINRTRKVHIVTIEDPVEVLHHDRLSSISQREVGVDTPDFASAMRVALRQDPDVILVGEMRDAETAMCALNAAETGHLVLSTLHTIDAAETINRIIELFPSHQQRHVRQVLAGSLKGTVCQRLVPTLDGASRLPACEVMVVNGRIQQCILDPTSRDDIPEIIADGEWYGMQTFDQSLARLFEQGEIDLRDTIAAASNPHDIAVELRRKGLIGTGAA
jgi:twitching motility protein PilT